jgi:hypothetical protein
VNQRRGEWAVAEVEAAVSKVKQGASQLDLAHFEVYPAKWQSDTATLEVFPRACEVNPVGFDVNPAGRRVSAAELQVFPVTDKLVSAGGPVVQSGPELGSADSKFVAAAHKVRAPPARWHARCNKGKHARVARLELGRISRDDGCEMSFQRQRCRR